MLAWSAEISASRRCRARVDSTESETVMRSTVRGAARPGQPHWTRPSPTVTLCVTMDHVQPSADGSICDVPGIAVGHMTDEIGLTGCTVILCEAGAVGGVDVRGAAPGTRETDLLDPINLVEKVHAIVLSGGSAFGLDTASGVMRYLEEHNIGFDTRAARVPIVPAAILYD